MNETPLTGAVPGLDFRTYDLGEAGSISALFVDPDHRCGIYVLDFADGDTYVGRTVNIVSRYAKHRRTWSDIVGLRFAECERGALTVYEDLMIKRQEELGDVRNRNNTGRPGGSDDLLVTTASGGTIVLPWDRARRVRLAAPEVPPSTATAGQQRRLRALKQLTEYAELVNVMGCYVAGSIPDPVGTQGIWSLTAMPAYNREYPRLATLSIGQIEVLWVYLAKLDSGRVGVGFNVRGDTEIGRVLSKAVSRKARRRFGIEQSIRKLTYPIQQISVLDLETCHQLLAQNAVLDAAYKLNVTLMRQGSRAYSRYHNRPFAGEVLAAAYAWQSRLL